MLCSNTALHIMQVVDLHRFTMTVMCHNTLIPACPIYHKQSMKLPSNTVDWS